MKSFIGVIIFCIGIGLFYSLVSLDLNVWYIVMPCVVMGYGIELIIDGKIEKAKEGLISELEK